MQLYLTFLPTAIGLWVLFSFGIVTSMPAPALNDRYFSINNASLLSLNLLHKRDCAAGPLYCPTTGGNCQAGSSCCGRNCCSAGYACYTDGTCRADIVYTYCVTATSTYVSNIASVVYNTVYSTVRYTTTSWSTSTQTIQGSIATTTLWVTVTKVLKRKQPAETGITASGFTHSTMIPTTPPQYVMAEPTPGWLLRRKLEDVGLLDKRTAYVTITVFYTTTIFRSTLATSFYTQTTTSGITTVLASTTTVIYKSASSTFTVTSTTVVNSNLSPSSSLPQPVPTTPVSPLNSDTTSSNSISPAIIGGAAGGGAFALIVVAIIIYCCCIKKPKRPEDTTSEKPREIFDEDPDPVGSIDDAKLYAALNPVLDSLDAKQYEFLDAVERAVFDTIRFSDSKDCAAIKETRNGVVKRIGIVTEFNHYPQRLHAMVRHKSAGLPTYKGATIDCWISTAIMKTVDDQRRLFFQQNSDVIGQGFANALQNDPYLRAAFAKQFADAVKRSGRPLTKHLYHSMREVLENSLITAGHAASAHMVNTFGTAATHAILASLSVAVVAALSHVLAHIIAHHVSMATVNALLAHASHAAIAKIVFAVVGSSLVHQFFAGSAHHFFGAAVLGMLVLPLIAGVAAWKIAEFPEKLAKEVAPKVRSVMEEEFRQPGSSFREQNRSILENMAREAFKNGCKDLAIKMVKDEIKGLHIVQQSESAAEEWARTKYEEVEEKFKDQHTHVTGVYVDRL